MNEGGRKFGNYDPCADRMRKPHQRLAHAVVVQALAEYSDALHTMKRLGLRRSKKVDELERDLRSPWFDMLLMGKSGDAIIKAMRERILDGRG